MNKIVSKSSIALTKRSNPIEEIISDDTKLKAQGDILVGPSPFRRGGLIEVSPKLQRFHCTASKQRGDVITYYRLRHKRRFVDSVEVLAERAGVELEYESEPKSRDQTSFPFGLEGAA